MPHLIAYAWLATVVVTIAVAAYRGVPVLHAFGWINTRTGLACSLTVLAIVCGLAVLQFGTDTLILNQRPYAWAMLVALVYAWAAIWWRLRRS